MFAVARRLGYGWMVAQGLLAALAPERSLSLNMRLCGLALDGVDDLAPKPWYVRAIRATGVGMVAAGGVGLLLEDQADGDGSEAGGSGQ
jgi:hypothetical protein